MQNNWILIRDVTNSLYQYYYIYLQFTSILDQINTILGAPGDEKTSLSGSVGQPGRHSPDWEQEKTLVSDATNLILNNLTW